MEHLKKPITLPCGLKIKNRTCKSAMTEGVANSRGEATDRHCRLYSEWSAGGTGLLISGNVQVDRRFVERPGNIGIDREQTEDQLKALTKLAAAGKENNTSFIAQLSHAGRQSDKRINKHVVGPSAIHMDVKLLPPPKGSTIRALTIEEIEEIQDRFVYAATVCEKVGFDGIQLHCAHGYLLSQFLNPLANVRTDKYGGSIENRSRIILETFDKIRAAVSPKFAVGVKINSSDMQKGGFTIEDCCRVATLLDDKGCDFIEVSGGNYESLVMFGVTDKKTSLGTNTAREAYFLEFAQALRKSIKNAPLMITGGFRNGEGMNRAIENGDCDIVGAGRPFCLMPDCINKLFAGEIDELPRYERDLRIPFPLNKLQSFKMARTIAFFGQQYYMYLSQYSMADGKGPLDPKNFKLLSNFRQNTKIENAMAVAQEGLDCVGSHTNAKKK